MKKGACAENEVRVTPDSRLISRHNSAFPSVVPQIDLCQFKSAHVLMFRSQEDPVGETKTTAIRVGNVIDSDSRILQTAQPCLVM